MTPGTQIKRAAAHQLPPLFGRRFGVWGMGVTGRAVANLLAAHQAQLTLLEPNPRVAERLASFYPQARWHVGPPSVAAFADCEAVAVSPGVSPSDPTMAALADTGVKLFGELELLVSLAASARCIGITGTNGKSTTTSLCGAIVTAHRAAFVGGNLGTPIAAWLLGGAAEGCAVLELSSAQIEWLKDFAPSVAVVLNISPDHLERYGQSLAHYAACKAQLVAALSPQGTAVLNADDPRVRAMAALCAGRTWWFGQTPDLPGPGLWCGDDGVVHASGSLADNWSPRPLANPQLQGPHNRANAMAAMLAALALLHPVDPTPAVSPAMWAAYDDFAGLAHRLQAVGVLDGVVWRNDSKATNDESAATAVRAQAGPFVLLVGGKDKGAGYAALQAALGQKPPRAVVAFGAAQAGLLAALAAAGRDLHAVHDLEAACRLARKLARPGDTVLLSPACASFDAFMNYEARGEAFAAWVARAQRQPADG